MAPPSLDLQLSSASGVPFYRQIVDQIGAMVRSGRLKPGVPLPSARDLAAALTVSLITTRRAYADLESAGLVVCRQGQGTFVAAGVEEAARERAREDARTLLSEAITRALQLGLTPDDILVHVRNVLSNGAHHE